MRFREKVEYQQSKKILYDQKVFDAKNILKKHQRNKNFHVITNEKFTGGNSYSKEGLNLLSVDEYL